MRGIAGLRAAVLTLVVGLVALLAATTPAAAYAPVTIVHTEHTQVGPYTVTLGFSSWPLRAMKSLDFTFAPAGGIADKTGRLLISGPKVKPYERNTPLARHPRERDVWGLDVRSLDAPGSYTLRFLIDGPAGHGDGAFSGLAVLDQPGPPLGLSWAVAALPLIGLICLLAVAWRRARPRQWLDSVPL